MSLADNLLVNALVQRARQESQAMTQGRIGLGPDPNAGRGLNLGRGAGVALAPLHALGMAMEAGSTVGKLGTGTTAALLGALRRAQEGRYGSTVNAVAQTVPVVGAIAGASEAGRHMGGLDPLNVSPFGNADAGRALAAFMAQPGFAGQLAANEELAHTNRFASGAANEALNPLNYGGTIASVPGRLGKVGGALNAVNELQMLPLRAAFVAKRAPQGERLAALAPTLEALVTGGEMPSMAPVLAERARKYLLSLKRAPIPPRFTPEALAQGPLRRGQTTLDPTQLPVGPTLPPVVGPPRPGRRVVPETTLPDISYRPGNVPGRTPLGPALPPELGPLLPPEQGPALPTTGNVPRNLLELIGRKRQLGPPVPPAALPSLTAAVDAPQAASTYGRETFTLGNPQQLQDIATRLGVSQRPSQAPNPLADLLTSARGMGAPEPPPAAPVALARDQILADTVRSRSAKELTPLFRDLHRAVYGDRSTFAIPAMTGVARRGEFTVDTLLSHPDGNAAPAYLDYLATRVQQDTKAQAALAKTNPDLLADIMALDPPTKDVATQKRTIQAMFGAGPFKDETTQAVAAATPDVAVAPAAVAGDAQAAFDTILTSGDNGRMSGELPNGTAFWEKRLGVGPDEARALLDGAVADGRLGVGPDGALRFKPRAALSDAPLPGAPADSAATLANVDIPEAAPPVTPTQARDELFADAADVPKPKPLGGDIAAGGGGGGGLGGRTGLQILRDLEESSGVPAHAFRGTAILHPDQFTPELVQQSFGVTDTEARTLVDYLTGADIRQGNLPTVSGEGLPPALRAFLKDSRVANPDGTPLVLYHGAGTDFEEFRPSPDGMFGKGIYLTDDPTAASDYALKPRNADAPLVKPVYVSMRNPAILDLPPPNNTTPPELAGVAREYFAEEARRLGYDGIIGFSDDVGREYLVFDPTQVKSATGNRGTYDPNDPSLLRAMSPAINRAGEAIGGALAGGAIGGAAGLTQGDTPAERRANALKGAGLGLAVGGNIGYASPELLAAARQLAPAAAQKLGGSVLDPEMQALALQHAWDAQKAAPETAGVRGVEAFGAFWRQWGRQVVHTLKQFPQDATTRLTTLLGVAEKEFPGTSGRIPFWQKGLVQERAGQQSFLNNPVTGWFRDTGHADLIPLHGDIVGAEGTDVALAPQGKQFGGLGRAVSGGLMSAWTGNPIAMAYGAARGYAAPFVDAYMGLLNGAQHDALRFGMLESALDRDMPQLADTFLADLRSRGVDTTTLDGLGGRFSAADVDALAPGAGRDWADASEFLIRAQGDRIAFLSGDFRDKLAPGYTGKVTTLDKVVGRALKGLGPLAPFVQWQIRYTPVLAEIAARNPVATRLTLEAMAQGGTVDISTETPVLGAAARLRLGGQAGTVKVNPFAAVTPYSPESLNQAPELPEDATLYQRATNLGGKVGIRPHPLIQALAYVGGQDYRAPSSLSRTAGLEGLADIPLQLAGVPNGPGVRGALDAGRQLLSPVTGAGIPQSDPTATRYAELVLRVTGQPLSDPSNRGYMETIGERDNPLWVRALLESRGLAAAGNATGMVVPVPVTARSQEGLGAKAAPKLPVTIGQIRAAPSSDRAALLDAYQRAAASSPASATYAGTNSKDRKFLLLTEWDQTHQSLKRMAPQLYADRRKAYSESLR